MAAGAPVNAKGFMGTTLLFTQFADKAEIMKRLKPLAVNGPLLDQKLRHFERLRNSLAHANEYASSPDQAKHVCNLARELLSMRRQIREQLNEKQASLP